MRSVHTYFSPVTYNPGRTAMKNTMAILTLTILVGATTAAFVYASDADSTAAMDTAPGPAFQTIEGTLKQIDGHVYVVEEYITNYRGEEVKDKEVRVYVGSETKKLHGNKRVGDKIRVEMTSGGFANSVE
jgi:hypothetical protein